MNDTIIIPKSRYKELLEYEEIVKGTARSNREKLETLHEMVKNIAKSSRSWIDKAHILFSPAIKGRIQKFAPDFNPKLTKECYAADVMIFVTEFNKYMANHK